MQRIKSNICLSRQWFKGMDVGSKPAASFPPLEVQIRIG